MVLTHVDLIEKLLHYNRMAFHLHARSYGLTDALLVAMERTKDKVNF